MKSKCRCAWWFSRACVDNPEGRCECFEPCCNEGWYADDGDGYMDFMSERSTCICKKTSGGASE